MPNILKRFRKNQAEDYHFRDMEQTSTRDMEKATAALQDMLRLKESVLGGDGSPDETDAAAETAEEEKSRPEAPAAGSVEFAKTQAQAIIRDAEQQAQKILEEARQKAEEESKDRFKQASEAGYQEGFSKGYEAGRQDGLEEMRTSAQDTVKQVQSFLDDAANARDRSIDVLRGDLLNVAVTIAEKIIRISLKSSKDIINRMIISATEKLKKREWVRIYLADCDVSATVSADPALASTLAGLSGQVKIIPMQDSESGTCVIEMPDQIIDVSASTQLENIRTIIRDSRP